MEGQYLVELSSNEWSGSIYEWGTKVTGEGDFRMSGEGFAGFSMSGKGFTMSGKG